SFFYSSTHPPLLPPFPTRRSSDLLRSSRTTRISKCSGVSFGNSSIARDARRRADGPPDPLEKWGLRLPKRPPISSGTSGRLRRLDRKSTRLNSSHQIISYAVFCLK